MQKENEDVIKLRKASKLATVQGIRTVTEIMKKLIHDPWIQQDVEDNKFIFRISLKKYFMIMKV